nr:DNA translocase FtsK 4TM domain-containing protein [Caulobacteraceae bacterium]
MARVARRRGMARLWDRARAAWAHSGAARFRGALTAAAGVALGLVLAGYHAGDPSLNASSSGQPANWLGVPGANVADIAVQTLGLAAWAIALILTVGGIARLFEPDPASSPRHLGSRALAAALG